MRFFGLTDLGQIVKLDIEEEVGEDSQEDVKRIISGAAVLDMEKSTFSVEYTSIKHGDLVYETITKHPKEVYERISKAKKELDKRELAFMKHLFIVSPEDYSIVDIDQTEATEASTLKATKQKTKKKEINEREDL